MRHRFTYNHGASTPSTVYESASTSKLVSAVVIMDLVDRGELSLTTRASDLIDFWDDTAVTLQHLLSFTSGYSDDPPCINRALTTLEACVEDVYETNSDTRTPAGTVYYYAGTHLAVAGLMAMKATEATTWGQVFSAWKTRTGLFPSGVYDLPSEANPRLAGGMHWTAEEYLAFLRALATGTTLTEASRTAVFANQRGSATVGASPAWGHLMEDWSYGLGNWLECSSTSFDCGEGHRNSSAGAYGAYPFIDFDQRYVGIVAQQGPLGMGFKGVNLFRAAQAEIEAWAACE